jgi:hypothetical protein
MERWNERERERGPDIIRRCKKINFAFSAGSLAFSAVKKK